MAERKDVSHAKTRDKNLSRGDAEAQRKSKAGIYGMKADRFASIDTQSEAKSTDLFLFFAPPRLRVRYGLEKGEGFSPPCPKYRNLTQRREGAE